MTREQRDLLLKDLCARLPYGVVVATTDNDGTIPNFWMLDLYNRLTEDVRLTNCEVNADHLTDFCDVRPYLFPLSSITEEQIQELSKLGVSYGDYALHDSIFGLGISVDEAYIFFEFCYKHHIDFLGLIDLGLAIDATGLNIY